MYQSPFSFFRGAAALMAADLATTPATGIRVQACGDCHAANFGGFGSPERRLVFDINDFDETLPAPWEWDVKRLAASVVLASREIGCSEGHASDAARAATETYRTRMREYADMRALDVWYSHLDAKLLVDQARTPAAKKRWRNVEKKAERETAGHEFPRITGFKNGHRRIIDRPPLIYHPPEIASIGKRVRKMFQRYRLTLPEEKRVVLDRYRIVDVARKVAGIGSVGTRCAVALLRLAPVIPFSCSSRRLALPCWHPMPASASTQIKGREWSPGRGCCNLPVTCSLAGLPTIAATIFTFVNCGICG